MRASSCSHVSYLGSLFWNQILDEFLLRSRYAEDRRPEDEEKAIKIEARWRGFHLRKLLKIQNEAAVIIQKAFRAHTSRQSEIRRNQQRIEREKMRLMNKMAIIIQKTWRGYFSRKKNFDFFKRRSYITDVENKMNLLRHSLEQHVIRQHEQEKARAERLTADMLERLAGSRHHWIGTRAVPGVMRGVLEPVIVRVPKSSKKNGAIIAGIGKGGGGGTAKHRQIQMRQENNVANPQRFNISASNTVASPPVLEEAKKKRQKRKKGKRDVKDDRGKMPLVSDPCDPEAGNYNVSVSYCEELSLPSIIKMPEDKLKNSQELKNWISKTVGKNPRNIRVKPRPDPITEIIKPEKLAQGPFLPKGILTKTKYKPLRPTLRVQTDFYDTKNYIREEKMRELALRVSDEAFLTVKHVKNEIPVHFLRGEPYRVSAKYFREEDPSRFVGKKDFKSQVQPYSLFDAIEI